MKNCLHCETLYHNKVIKKSLIKKATKINDGFFGNDLCLKHYKEYEKYLEQQKTCPKCGTSLEGYHSCDTPYCNCEVSS